MSTDKNTAAVASRNQPKPDMKLKRKLESCDSELGPKQAKTETDVKVPPKKRWMKQSQSDEPETPSGHDAVENPKVEKPSPEQGPSGGSKSDSDARVSSSFSDTAGRLSSSLSEAAGSCFSLASIEKAVFIVRANSGRKYETENGRGSRAGFTTPQNGSKSNGTSPTSSPPPSYRGYSHPSPPSSELNGGSPPVNGHTTATPVPQDFQRCWTDRTPPSPSAQNLSRANGSHVVSSPSSSEASCSYTAAYGAGRRSRSPSSPFSVRTPSSSGNNGSVAPLRASPRGPSAKFQTLYQAAFRILSGEMGANGVSESTQPSSVPPEFYAPSSSAAVSFPSSTNDHEMSHYMSHYHHDTSVENMHHQRRPPSPQTRSSYTTLYALSPSLLDSSQSLVRTNGHIPSLQPIGTISHISPPNVFTGEFCMDSRAEDHRVPQRLGNGGGVAGSSPPGIHSAQPLHSSHISLYPQPQARPPSPAPLTSNGWSMKPSQGSSSHQSSSPSSTPTPSINSATPSSVDLGDDKATNADKRKAGNKMCKYIALFNI